MRRIISQFLIGVAVATTSILIIGPISTGSGNAQTQMLAGVGVLLLIVGALALNDKGRSLW